NQRCGPILRGEYVIDLSSLRHQSWPAYHRRNAISALPVGVLLPSERCCAPVRPRKRLGTVVRRVDDDRIVRDTEVVEFLEQLSDLPVMLDHTAGVDAQTGLVLRFGLQPSPDVHAARIEPNKKRLLIAVGTIDEIGRGIQKFLV